MLVYNIFFHANIGIGMISSFLWGVLLFSESITNYLYSSISIVLLAFGVYCVSTSQTNNTESIKENIHAPVAVVDDITHMDHESDLSSDRTSVATSEHGVYEMTTTFSALLPSANSSVKSISMSVASSNKELSIQSLENEQFHRHHSSEQNQLAHDDDDDDDNDVTTIRFDNDIPTRMDDADEHKEEIRQGHTPVGLSTLQSWEGYLITFMTGFCDGTLMVPFKLTKAKTLDESFCYLASFGISSIIICPMLFLLYIVFIKKEVSSLLFVLYCS